LKEKGKLFVMTRLCAYRERDSL